MRKYNTPKKTDLLKEFGINCKPIKIDDPSLNEINKILSKREITSLIKDTNQVLDKEIKKPIKVETSKVLKVEGASTNVSKIMQDKPSIMDDDDDDIIKTFEEADNIVKKYYKNIKFMNPDDYIKCEPGDRIIYIGSDSKLKDAIYIWKVSFTKSDSKLYWLVGKSPIPNNSRHVFRYILYPENVRFAWRIMNAKAKIKESIDFNLIYLKDVVAFLQKKYGSEFVNFMNKCEEDRQKNNAIKAKTVNYSKASPKMKNIKTS